MMKYLKLLFGLVALMFFAGCATTGPTVSTTPLSIALSELPEDELMDVGIQLFEIDEDALKKDKKTDAQQEIKKAEAHYIPTHLMKTLQESAYWGAVQVTPVPTDGVDLHISGVIRKSNGLKLQVRVTVEDATGEHWYTKTYTGRSGKNSYISQAGNESDAFQDVYNRIANDLLNYKQNLAYEEIIHIREVAALRFASELAPDAFGDYLDYSKKGTLSLKRLPPTGDPMYDRLMNIREREFALLDTMNQHYVIFYDQMWDPYHKWREFDKTETEALMDVKKRAWVRGLSGAALIAAAIILENNSSGSSGTKVLRDVAVLGGFEVVKSGINISQEAKLHASAVEELGESFSAEIRPAVIHIEGETLRLTGTAEEQYQQWREILQKIYVAETGFDPSSSEINKALEEEPEEIYQPIVK